MSQRVLGLALTAAMAVPGWSLPAQAPAAGLTRIGVAGGVSGKVEAFAPGTLKPIGRVLTSGEPLYLNETIKTGPSGRLQVMLIDETVFTIGPNSSMALDEFVYDPASHAGKVTATVKNGVFRFVTGQIGHKNPSDMTVKFPIGTMGIRGTIVAGLVTPNGTTAVLLGPGPQTNASVERVGAFRMENAGAFIDVRKPGYATHVESGLAPTAPALMTRVQLDGILGQLGHAPGHVSHPATAASDDKAPDSDQSPAATPSEGDSSASSDAGISDGTVADASGQSTAQAMGDLSNTQDITDLSADLGNATLTAANEIANPDLANLIAQNQAAWDDVRTVTSGTGYYDGVGDFNLIQCGGAACAAPSGSVSMHLDIDFGAKTIGSAASNVTVSASDANLPAAINETVNFAQASYANTVGAATLSGISASGNTAANISLLNLGGTAQTALAIAKYNDGATMGSGFAGAPLTCTSGSCQGR